MNDADLKKIKQVTDVAYQAALAEMSQLIQSIEELRQQLDELEKKSKAVILEKYDSNSPASRARADVQWLLWSDQSRKEINQELARLLARKPDLEGKLRKCFGKREAVKLLEESFAQAKRIKAKRQLY